MIPGKAEFSSDHHLLELPVSDYTFCFLYPDGVTEDWATEIVEFWTEDAEGQLTHWSQFKNYLTGKLDEVFAIESLRTLFQSLNIHDKTIAVCQRK